MLRHQRLLFQGISRQAPFLLPSIRFYKSAPMSLTEKKRRERLEKHLQKEQKVKEQALSQKQQLIQFQVLSNAQIPPYIINACFIPTIVQFLVCGSVYLNSDFFTPSNSNSIVAMAHIFSQNIVVLSAAVLGYETTRTAIPEQTIAQQRYKAEVKPDVAYEKAGRGFLIEKAGKILIVYSVVLCGVGLTWMDSLSPFAGFPFLLNGFILKKYSQRQAEQGLLPFWVLRTIKLNSAFIIMQVTLMILMILARVGWIQRMESQKADLELKIEEKLEGRVLSVEEKKEMKARKESQITKLSNYVNVWK